MARFFISPYTGDDGQKAFTYVTASHQRLPYETDVVTNASVAYIDTSQVRLRRRCYLRWDKNKPQRILIIKKENDERCKCWLKKLADYLIQHGVHQILVEKSVQTDEFPEFMQFDPDEHGDSIDLCVTLGGDGTVLTFSQMYSQDKPMPPVLSFAMGTLGFLTAFEINAYKTCFEKIFNTSTEPLTCTMRSRKYCQVLTRSQRHPVLLSHHVLNECVIDRGLSTSMLQLEVFIDGQFITTVQADGLIVATPSGSTAYSVSAGGPMVAPSVPCTILTPIAPHSLSFRPIVVPETSEILIYLPAYSRTDARVSFDGRVSVELKRNSCILFSISMYPIAQINLQQLDGDWYDGISSKLMWNNHLRQGSGPSLKFDLAQEQDAIDHNSKEVNSYMGERKPSFIRSGSKMKYTGSVKDITLPLYSGLINERNSRRKFSDVLGDQEDSGPDN